ncbi:TPA: hypothetical protein KWZ05_004198 [Escherichia coli]|nr:hypothetical protein [Escherichia coli]
MQHVPEGVIQAPESPDAPEALPGCRSISDDDLCLVYPSALPSRRNQSVQTEYRQWHLAIRL